MSVYNGEKFLKEAIDSVLNQTYTDFEFIIYNDCSTDNSSKIIESYCDKRIVLINNEQNRGLTVNLHDGMNKATSKYIARMDADDICMPDRFQNQLNFLEANPDISILGSSVIFFDEYGTEILGTQPLTHDEIIVELLLGYTMMHPSVMMRLSDFKKHNLNYNPHFRYSQDFDLWVRVSRILKMANLSKPLIKMREHSSKISRALKPEQKAFSDEIRTRQLQELKVDLSEKEIEAFNLSASGSTAGQKNIIKNLENALISILNSNHFYDNNKLNISASNLFIYTCRELLLNKNSEGLYYWSSKLVKFKKISISHFLGMSYHSLRLLFRN